MAGLACNQDLRTQKLGKCLAHANVSGYAPVVHHGGSPADSYAGRGDWRVAEGVWSKGAQTWRFSQWCGATICGLHRASTRLPSATAAGGLPDANVRPWPPATAAHGFQRLPMVRQTHARQASPWTPSRRALTSLRPDTPRATPDMTPVYTLL